MAKPQSEKPARKHESKGHLASSAYGKKGSSSEPDWALVEQYLPLVKGVLARMRMHLPPQAEMEDLYSVGISGLITAIKRRDPRMEKSFGSYAMLRVRGAILDELRRMDWMPRSDRSESKRIRQTVEKLEQKLQRPATDKEVANELGISLKEYHQTLEQIRPITLISLDRTVNREDSDRATIHEVVSDDTELNAREKAEKREMVKLMRERIKDLPEIPRKVLMMYYFEGMRLAEIAAVFDLTESRICQIHAQAVVSLRTYLEKITNK